MDIQLSTEINKHINLNQVPLNLDKHDTKLIIDLYIYACILQSCINLNTIDRVSKQDILQALIKLSNLSINKDNPLNKLDI